MMAAAMWMLAYRDLWSPIWPNLAASALWTLPALAWHHRRMRSHVTAELRRHHEALSGRSENGATP